MALIKCPECGREISDKAVSCPGCGYPISSSDINTTNDISTPENSIDSLVADVVSRNNYKKVQAIKELTALTGKSLSECKNLVDTYCSSHSNNNTFKPKKVIEGVSIDAINKKWQKGLFGPVRNGSEIVDVNIYENGSSLSNTRTGSMLGRAAIGAMINPVGAAVGAVTAKRNSVDLITSIQVVVSTTDPNESTVTIDIKIPKKTKKDSKDYTKAIGKARELEAALKALTF